MEVKTVNAKLYIISHCWKNRISCFGLMITELIYMPARLWKYRLNCLQRTERLGEKDCRLPVMDVQNRFRSWVGRLSVGNDIGMRSGTNSGRNPLSPKHHAYFKSFTQNSPKEERQHHIRKPPARAASPFTYFFLPYIPDLFQLCKASHEQQVRHEK